MKTDNTLSAGAPAMETAIAAHAVVVYILRLYIAGLSPRSARAISNIRKICEEHLEGRYDLDVVDISQQPGQAQIEQIIAAPTLVKKWPLPARRFVGDMSRSERIVLGLDLREAVEKTVSARRAEMPCL
ncbi:MAG TPA: circadian clock KaiB family protein [Stellaceae bacterium]|nr:circadian clock KaiB family protein [Stellaceae bacterium]